MKKLYVNDKLVLVIYDNDLQVDTGDDYGDTYNLDSYIMQTIQSNLDFQEVGEIIVEALRHKDNPEALKKLKRRVKRLLGAAKN